MENFPSFSWGHLYYIHKIMGFVPYLPKSNKKFWIWDKWQLYSILHILFNIFVFVEVYKAMMSFSDSQELMPFIFTLLDIFGYPFSLIFGLLTIMCRASNIILLLKYHSKVASDLSSFTIRKRKNYILNFFLCYVIYQFAASVILSCAMLNVSYFSAGFLLNALYSNNQLLLLDLNFCVFVMNTRCLFQDLNSGFRNLNKREVLVEELKTFRKIYPESCEVAELVGKCFMDSITINTCIEFVGFVLGSYLGFQRGSLINSFNMLYWTAFFFCKMAVKVYICSSTSKEVNMILIHCLT